MYQNLHVFWEKIWKKLSFLLYENEFGRFRGLCSWITMNLDNLRWSGNVWARLNFSSSFQLWRPITLYSMVRPIWFSQKSSKRLWLTSSKHFAIRKFIAGEYLAKTMKKPAISVFRRLRLWTLAAHDLITFGPMDRFHFKYSLPRLYLTLPKMFHWRKWFTAEKQVKQLVNAIFSKELILYHRFQGTCFMDGLPNIFNQKSNINYFIWHFAENFLSLAGDI